MARSSGLAIGLRGAYGVPVGTAFDPIEQSSFGNTLSPQLDVTCFFNEQLSLGGYFQYGVSSGGDCNPEGKCSGSVMRLGVDLNYHFAPRAIMRPWVGVGAGYEQLKRTLKTDERRLAVSLRGFEMGHVNVGFDFQLNPTVFVGPYFTTTLAQAEDNLAAVRLQLTDEQVRRLGAASALPERYPHTFRTRFPDAWRGLAAGKGTRSSGRPTRCREHAASARLQGPIVPEAGVTQDRCHPARRGQSVRDMKVMAEGF
ncbi:hypothetical protein JGU66_35270 [Myxococcaceae bacterium JPH2]|nr:hypothetical protein [Myxococcaceae bacterium JPH2]